MTLLLMGPLNSNKTNLLSPLLTNGLPHPYHLYESILIFRGTGCKFSFFGEQNSPSRESHLRRHIWDYSGCQCPIKGTPGLYGLMQRFQAENVFIFSSFMSRLLIVKGLLNISELDPIRRHLPASERPKANSRYSSFQVSILNILLLLL